MAGQGRPLRFLLYVSAGWAAVRVVMLWPAVESLPDALLEIVPIPLAAQAAPSAHRAGIPYSAPRAYADRRAPQVKALRFSPVATSIKPASLPRMVAGSPGHVESSGAISAQQQYALGIVGAIAPQVTPVADLTRSSPAGRWSASAWLIARGGTGLGASADAPQLGGAQGGVRLDYGLARGFAVTGRIAAPAAGAGREASLGIAWRPAGVPLRFVVERRFALDGGRGGTALGVSGGIDGVGVGGGFRLEGYAQGGVILRTGVDHYVDGVARIARPAFRAGTVRIDTGIGAWGGAQRDVARLDIGPTIGIRVPMGGVTVRGSLDWRHRVVGNARPGSGPALTFGADF